MDSNGPDGTLPSGCRSDLVNALHADDIEAVIKHLGICSLAERHTLLGEKAGKGPSMGWPFLPWSLEEAKHSRIKKLDNALFNIIWSEIIESEKQKRPPKSFRTMVFHVAAASGCVHVVSMLSSDK